MIINVFLVVVLLKLHASHFAASCGSTSLAVTTPTAATSTAAPGQSSTGNTNTPTQGAGGGGGASALSFSYFLSFLAVIGAYLLQTGER